MKRIVLLAVLGLVAAPNGMAVQEDADFQLPVETFTLDNGMRFVVVTRKQVPRVFCSLWWRVGSVHERPGITGLSHFFEHMMFMGTKTIGTKDWKTDAELNEKIEDTMSEIRTIKLARLEAKRRGLEPDAEGENRYKELWAKYEGFIVEQKKITIPEHLSKIFQAHGGTSLNATTSYDRTNYFVELPANKTELFFWLESDRFSDPVFRSFYPEREVVKEERRMRTDSTPTGLIEEAFYSMFWEAHPYSWPVIGWMSDIDQYTLKDAQEYYDTHYSPENGTAIFVGDIEVEAVKALAKKYFSRLKRFPGERPAIVTQEPEQLAEKRMIAEADAQPELTIWWHAPSGVHKDTANLDLLAAVFSGRSGRLYRPLVEQQKLAVGASSWYWSRRFGGVMNIGISPKEDTDLVKLEEEVYKIIEDIKENGVSARELQKARNQTIANNVRSMSSYSGIANQLGYFETIGTTDDFFNYQKLLKAATAEDLQRCARTYMTQKGRNVLIIKRRKK